MRQKIRVPNWAFRRPFCLSGCTGSAEVEVRVFDPYPHGYLQQISGLLLETLFHSFGYHYRSQDASLMCMKPGVSFVLTRSPVDSSNRFIILSLVHSFSHIQNLFITTGVQQMNTCSRMLSSFSQHMHCLEEFMHLYWRIGAAPPLSIQVELYSHFCLIIYRYLVEWLIRETSSFWELRNLPLDPPTGHRGRKIAITRSWHCCIC